MAGWPLLRTALKLKTIKRLAGELAFINIIEAAERIAELQDLVKQYENRNIFNYNETGLY